jgi:hypothetical protein
MGIECESPTNGVKVVYCADVTSKVVLKLGAKYLWFDTNGILRMSGAVPVGDLLGQAIGSQS